MTAVDRPAQEKPRFEGVAAAEMSSVLCGTEVVINGRAVRYNSTFCPVDGSSNVILMESDDDVWPDLRVTVEVDR